MPRDAQDPSLDIDPAENWYMLSYCQEIYDEDSGFYGEWEEVDIDLPPGSWQILGRPKEISEEVWKGLVEFIHGYEWAAYFDYEDVYCSGYHNTAIESGLSWCRANGIDEENSLLIIKNK